MLQVSNDLETEVTETSTDAPVFPLTSKQQAVFDALQTFADASTPRSKFVLSGLAGTGKTTVITRFIESLHRQGFRVGLAAPTGKAARVLNSKQSAVKAVTLHRLFGAVPITVSELEQVEFDKLLARHLLAEKGVEGIAPLTKNEEERFFTLQKIVDKAKKKVGFGSHKAEEVDANYDIVVIDEASMLGKKSHAEDLGLNQINIPIVFIGDPGQLPPVKDECCVNWTKPDAHLSEILRQAGTSGIVPYSHAIYQGAWPTRADMQGIPNVTILPNAAPRTVLNAEDNHQVLVYKNTTRHQFNWMIRDKRGVTGEIHKHYPAVGEVIMCRKNAYSKGLFNGSLLTVTKVYQYQGYKDNLFLCIVDGIDEDGLERREIPVSMHDMCSTVQLYSSKMTNDAKMQQAQTLGIEFLWTYALTVHKSQGSEWEKVMLIGEMNPRTDEGRKWWYTGVTRAKNELTIATLEIK